VGPTRLLLVDDNPELLRTVIDILQPSYVIAGALSDGTTVVQRAAILRPDIIILDISLREVTGFDIARRLKKSGFDAKIIFLTVHENVDFIRAAFELGAAAYVFKSRIVPDLVDALHRVCRGKCFSSGDLAAAGADRQRDSGRIAANPRDPS